MLRCVVITGCSGGIGEAICKLFHTKKWYVIGVDIDTNYNKNVVDRFYNVNLEVEGDIEAMCRDIGRIDCLINNAGYQICKSIVDTTSQEFKKVLNCNVVAPFLLAKYSLEQLRLTEGCIINIGSVHAVSTSDKISAYSCSKSAIVGLTRNMAIEFAKYGIRVNCVSPGAIDTPMLRGGLIGKNKDINININKLVDQLGKKHVVGRVGRPDEVAKLVYFLGNKDKSSNITGSNFIVDGGATIRLSTE